MFQGIGACDNELKVVTIYKQGLPRDERGNPVPKPKPYQPSILTSTLVSTLLQKIR